MTNKQLVELIKVCVIREGKRLIDNIDLEIFSEEIVTLIGPNGAGKSTLVKLILGLIKPDSGTLTRTTDLQIGYMPQHFHLEQTMPLQVSRLLTLSGRVSKQETEAALGRVGATHLVNKLVHSLSGGELQRVLLARAILRKPQLLVLDEPVQGVDISGQDELYSLITRLREELECAILMVSHDLHLVMATTDRVVCINHHVCCSGHPELVSNDPAYHELFGIEGTGEGLALYTHHHDHSHDEKGNVLISEK